MSQEMEGAALGSAGGLGRKGGHEPAAGEICLNCETVLEGRFCHACGQVNDNFQRPFLKLLGEGATDLFAIDSRVARTIPALIFRPGRVTRNYIDGKRARYVPPFRLYLLVSVLCFFVFFSFGATEEDISRLVEMERGNGAAVEQTTTNPDDTGSPGAPESPALPSPETSSDSPSDVGEISKPDTDSKSGTDIVTIPDEELSSFGKRLENNIKDFVDDPRRHWLMIQSWAPRISLALVPLTVLGLALAFPFRKNVFIYDHIVTALHYQTFTFIMSAIVMVMPTSLQSLMTSIYFFALPIYFWRMICVVYGSSWWLGGLRTFILWIAAMVSISLLVVALVTVVLATA